MSAISRHEPFAKNKSIEIKYLDERKYKTTKAKGDRFLIMIAISNLIGNAVKYGFENGIVEVKVYDSENNLIFEVCDNGPGIPEKEQKNIFQDFFRASNIRKMVSEGAGLGLSFVKQIIDKHNGKITFQSPSRLQEHGKPGTCFKISLPV
jgi:signal transduction histidine kinase